MKYKLIKNILQIGGVSSEDYTRIYNEIIEHKS